MTLKKDVLLLVICYSYGCLIDLEDKDEFILTGGGYPSRSDVIKYDTTVKPFQLFATYLWLSVCPTGDAGETASFKHWPELSRMWSLHQ